MNAEKLKNFKDYSDALPEVLKENFLTLSGINADTKQAAVASALGVGDSTITAWKKAGPSFNADSIARIAAAYNVDPALLLKKDMRIDCQPETIGDAVRVIEFLMSACAGNVELTEDNKITVTFNNEFLTDFFKTKLAITEYGENSFNIGNGAMSKQIYSILEKGLADAYTDANNMPLSVYGSREMWHMFQKIAEIITGLCNIENYSCPPLTFVYMDGNTFIEFNAGLTKKAAADFGPDLIGSVYVFAGRYIEKFGYSEFTKHICSELPSGTAGAIYRMNETFLHDVIETLYAGITE